jgi:dTMP kinase
MPGRFIVFEGLDGSGKTSMQQAVASALRVDGIDVCETSEPAGTSLGRKIREAILFGTERLSPWVEVMLFATARLHHIETVIKPALARGMWVLSDRYAASTRAYQGDGRRVDPGFIGDAEVLSGSIMLVPDLTILIDVPVVEAARRVIRRRINDGASPGGDSFESADMDFRERVRRGYLDMVEASPSERVMVIDGMLSKNEAHVKAYERIRAQFAIGNDS